MHDSLMDVADDSLCCKSGADWLGRSVGLPTKNVLFENIEVRNGHVRQCLCLVFSTAFHSPRQCLCLVFPTAFIPQDSAFTLCFPLPSFPKTVPCLVFPPPSFTFPSNTLSSVLSSSSPLSLSFHLTSPHLNAVGLKPHGELIGLDTRLGGVGRHAEHHLPWHFPERGRYERQKRWPMPLAFLVCAAFHCCWLSLLCCVLKAGR